MRSMTGQEDLRFQSFVIAMPSSPVDTWSIQDVQVYLDELGLSQLKAIFLKNGGASFALHLYFLFTLY